MTDNLTVLALRHEATARALAKYQVDPAEVFRAAGLDPEPYRDPDSRLRSPAIRKLWEQCIEADEKSVLRVRSGYGRSPANLHAIGYAWLASRNVREALAAAGALSPAAVDRRSRCELEENETRTDVRDRHRPAGWPQEAIDA